MNNAKLKQIELAVLQWISKQGHDSCWYYPDIFNKIATILEIDVPNRNLPSLNEFREGCCKYQSDLYKDFACSNCCDRKAINNRPCPECSCEHDYRIDYSLPKVDREPRCIKCGAKCRHDKGWDLCKSEPYDACGCENTYCNICGWSGQR